MRPFSALALVAVLAAVSPIIASDPPTAADATDGPWEVYSLEATLTELEVDYGLWLETALSGIEPERDRLEKAMLSLVNYDIFVTQERVRTLAKAAARQSWRQQRDTLEVPSEESVNLQKAIGELNTKEALYRSISKSNAFSNKYRLLGDYINLLRRELELPKLKLATEKVVDTTGGPVGSSLPSQK